MQNNHQMTWRELNIKEKIAIITAIAAFSIGWGMSIAAFVVPPVGLISDSVLWVLGQALVYAASVFGVTSYFTSETFRMKKDIGEIVARELREHKNEEETDETE